ncbi:hypothetical protein XANCAGTX0491_003669 [Xanthoria calcicola]
MALPISLTQSLTLNNPSENTSIPKPPTMWPNEKKPQPLITQIHYSYAAKPPRESNQEETQITYLNLPKIPLRIRSLPSDLSLLGTQFWDTLSVLHHLLYRRTFAPQATPPLQQQQQEHEYQIVHLHTNPEISVHQLSHSLTLGPSRAHEEIPLIFPVAAGIWELLIKKPYLANLMPSSCSSSSSSFPLNFQLPSQLPKGIVGRAAHIRAVARGNDRWVWEVHLTVLERFPWHHVMKDTAESMSIRQAGCAVIGGRVYVL